MAYEHCNRRGDVYLLQASKTRTGKRRYYFGRKLTGEPVEAVPAGYEVFESPERGQVFLRKARPTCIEPMEREIVVEGIRRLSNVEHFIVDVEEDCLVVYLPTMNVNEVNDLVSHSSWSRCPGGATLPQRRGINSCESRNTRR